MPQNVIEKLDAAYETAQKQTDDPAKVADLTQQRFQRPPRSHKEMFFGDFHYLDFQEREFQLIREYMERYGTGRRRMGVIHDEIVYESVSPSGERRYRNIEPACFHRGGYVSSRTVHVNPAPISEITPEPEPVRNNYLDRLRRRVGL